MIMSTRGVVSSGHYLATGVGIDILRRGGNAMDAAAATGFALTVLKPHQNGIAGEVPMLVYSQSERRTVAISGHGTAPHEATLERFHDYGLKVIPGDGFLPAIVPSAVASWILLLERYGRLRLAETLGPAIELARQGFPVYDALHAAIANQADKFRSEWPTSAEVFLSDGKAPGVGTVWKNPYWAATMERLLQAERRFRNRKDGLRAALNEFYQGEIAEIMVEFARGNAVRDASGDAHTGLLAVEDFERFEARVEDPVNTTYRSLTVHKCSSWTQGPVLLQVLNLLENADLASMGHNSADYIHTVTECMKLAYADREFYYGDPLFVEVPLNQLLSKEYARERYELVDSNRASLELRPGGLPPARAESILDVDSGSSKSGPTRSDTTKLEVVDKAGNMVSAMPSGGWLMSSPAVPGLGFPLGTRGQMFSLEPGHPNALQPGKRPRTTLTPTLASKEGRPLMVFGSPGGDCQDQWGLQFLLNVVDFDMSLQEAVEAPTFWTRHFPSSFYPRTAEPGSLYVEGRVPREVLHELSELGHVVSVQGDWSGGNTLAAGINPETGVRCAAASPRLQPAYALGW